MPLKLVIALFFFPIVFADAFAQPARSFESSSSSVLLVNAFSNLNFERSLYLTHAGDGSNRVFVVEKGGIVHVFENDPAVTSTQVFVDISAKLQANVGETGLLSLAFHPDFATNKTFYLSYVDADLVSVISEMKVSADSNQADPSSERILLTLQQPQRNHNGGHIAFGPDGYLYIAFGDGFSEAASDGIEHGDPLGHGQNLETWFSSMLRIDVDRQSDSLAYGIPPDNPYIGNTQNWREEIYAHGFRNPWRFSFDREKGDLWLADVGDKKAEEIDFVQSGKNYGWNLKEASHCFEDIPCDTTAWVGLEDPIYEYLRDVGESITGGYVYNGSAIPEFKGKYIYGDFDVSKVWMLTYENGEIVQNELIANVQDNISSFGEDEQGEIYVVGYNGRIFRFIDNNTTASELPTDAPYNYRLHPNYPNPFYAKTSIAFDVVAPGPIKVTILNALGQVVTTLADRSFQAGTSTLIWNGRDAQNKRVPSGVYFYTLESNDTKLSRSMLLIR